MRSSADGRLAMAYESAAVSDPASAGEVCLRAWEVSGDETYLKAARAMLNYLQHTAPRTSDGIICHNTVSFHEGFSPYQLWIDGVYMVPPFLAVMGYLDDAAAQIRGYCKHLLDAETGLFFHIVDVQTGRFVRKLRWATGNGWAQMGIARVIEEAVKAGRNDLKEEMLVLEKSLLDSMLRYQLPDGRFHDILDDEASFVDGTSAMMMSAAIYRLVGIGLLDASYLPYADKAYSSVLTTIDDIGIIHEVCGCPDFLSEGTSAEAQAAFLMADAWKKRL